MLTLCCTWPTISKAHATPTNSNARVSSKVIEIRMWGIQCEFVYLGNQIVIYTRPNPLSVQTLSNIVYRQKYLTVFKFGSLAPQKYLNLAVAPCSVLHHHKYRARVYQSVPVLLLEILEQNCEFMKYNWQCASTELAICTALTEGCWVGPSVLLHALHRPLCIAGEK